MKASSHRLSFLLVLLSVPSAGLFAQSPVRSLLEQYAATPKAQSENRYGNLPVDPVTGSVSLSVPVGSYSDQDFDIPVSLNYHYGGFRPSGPSGEAGLGWSLSAGGHTLSQGISSTIQGWTESQSYHLGTSQVFTESIKYWDPTRTGVTARYGGKAAEITSQHGGMLPRTEAYAYDGMGAPLGHVLLCLRITGLRGRERRGRHHV